MSVLVALVAAAPTPAHAQAPAPWVARAERLAQRIEAENMLVTPAIRAERQADAARLRGAAKLQALYDIAVDDFVASDAEKAAVSLAALEVEAGAQNNARYRAMAGVLRAYRPILDGDYVAARNGLTAALEGEHDPYVRAAGSRLLAYVLTDMGLVGNALETARSSFAQAAAEPGADSLVSGLHDAMAYTALWIGDAEGTLSHMQRTVELDRAAGRPVTGDTVIFNIVTLLSGANEHEAALRVLPAYMRMAQRSDAVESVFFANLLCASTNYAADRYQPALSCADAALGVRHAPPEYLTNALVLRVKALARLNQAHEARAALIHLQRWAADRADPSLNEGLPVIEADVLRAEGRSGAAYTMLREAFRREKRDTLHRFNDGVKELRATLENEVAQAEERAVEQEARTQLQAHALEKAHLAAGLALLCLVAAIGLVVSIYRSRRDMLLAVARAESLLARRGAGRTGAVVLPAEASGHKQRLNNLLDEIERRDLELERAFAEIEAAREAAEEANAAKSRFLTTVSHELRTPLNAIIGYSELLMEEAEDSAGQVNRQADLARIHNAGQRLLTLIEDVLDLAKIEAGRAKAVAQTIDVADLLDDVMATVSPMVAANGNSIAVEAAGLGDAHTDGLKLSQCLLNLMSNAAKFTKDGVITLRARREGGDGMDWLVFAVADTGIGISPETQARLFTPFVQADESITRAYGGTGLGLAITRQLAHLLGGDVSLVSNSGEGSVFTLRVPAVLQAANNNTEELAAA